MTTVNESKVKLNDSWVPLVPYATTTSKGIVQIGDGLTVENGIASVDGIHNLIVDTVTTDVTLIPAGTGTFSIAPSITGTYTNTGTSYVLAFSNVTFTPTLLSLDENEQLPYFINISENLTVVGDTFTSAFYMMPTPYSMTAYCKIVNHQTQETVLETSCAGTSSFQQRNFTANKNNTYDVYVKTLKSGDGYSSIVKLSVATADTELYT